MFTSVGKLCLMWQALNKGSHREMLYKMWYLFVMVYKDMPDFCSVFRSAMEVLCWLQYITEGAGCIEM